MHSDARLDGLVDLLSSNQDAVVLAWFPATIQRAEEKLRQAGITHNILLCRNATSFVTNQKKVFILEHYPVFEKEKTLLENWTAKEIIFLNALDEPFFEKFGGEKIIRLMQSMGMKENETIEHPMISSSIENAQHKIQKSITVDRSAQSQEEWFRINV